MKPVFVFQAMRGVVKVLLAGDIPGENNTMPAPYSAEELLCSGQVMYAGQAVAIVIAGRSIHGIEKVQSKCMARHDLFFVLGAIHVIEMPCHQCRGGLACTCMHSDQVLFCWLHLFNIFTLMHM